MAIPTVDANAFSRASTASSLDVTLSVTSGSGRVLLAFPQTWQNAQTHTINSVTFDPGGSDEASFTEETGASALNTPVGQSLRSEAWYLVLDDGVTSGSYTVRLTLNESANRVGMAVWEVGGADTTDPIGASGTGTGSGTELSVDVTTTAANSLVAAGGNHTDNGNFTPGTSDTEVNDDATNLLSVWAGHTDAASTGTYTVSADIGSSDSWAMSGVEILEASGGGTEYNQSAAGSVAPAGALDRLTSISPAGTLAPAGAISRQTATSSSGSVAPAGALVRQAIKAFAGSISPAGALETVKIALQSVGGTLPLAGALVREAQKGVAGSVAPAGALARQAQKAVAGALSPAGALVKQAAKALAGSISPAGALTTVKTVLQSVGGSIAPAGALVRQAQKDMAGTLAPSGGLIRQVAKGVAGTLAPAGALVKQTAISLAGTLTPAGVASGVKTTIAGLVALTAPARSFALSVTERVFDLAAKARSFALTAEDRD